MRLSLTIKSRIHDYAVEEVTDLASALTADAAASRCFGILDARVAELHRETLEAALPPQRQLLVTATETAKSYGAIGGVIEALLERGFQRRDTLIVMGGGVIQDIGAFLASNLMRGVAWIYYPTTLLAQCDSCIGAKSSVNVGRFKNQIGTFYPPHIVRMAFSFLATLPVADRLSGLGEAVKLHLIAGESDFARIQEHLARVSDDPSALRAVVGSSLRIKQRFIEEDEFDRGVRNLLNYGHTFAHAFESATHYAIPHGIAVSMGVACATLYSADRGFSSATDPDRIVPCLRGLYGGFLAELRKADPTRILDAMKLDKKNAGDQITFILTRGPGKMFKEPVAHAMMGDALRGLIERL